MDLRLSSEIRYSKSCLPFTMTIAIKFKSALLPKLVHLPDLWPFEDQVLVFLIPSLRGDVASYHTDGGPEMSSMFHEHLLKHFDDDLSRELCEKLEQIILDNIQSNIPYSRSIVESMHTIQFNNLVNRRKQKAPMPAVASLEDLKTVQRQLEDFGRRYPDAEKKLVEILKMHRNIGYKNICKMLMKEASPEQLKSGKQD